MRLLTHNTLTNNAADAKNKGFPLRISAKVIRVDESVGNEEVDRQMMFIKGVLPSLQWDALVQVCALDGIENLKAARLLYQFLTWSASGSNSDGHPHITIHPDHGNGRRCRVLQGALSCSDECALGGRYVDVS